MAVRSIENLETKNTKLSEVMKALQDTLPPEFKEPMREIIDQSSAIRNEMSRREFLAWIYAISGTAALAVAGGSYRSLMVRAYNSFVERNLLEASTDSVQIISGGAFLIKQREAEVPSVIDDLVLEPNKTKMIQGYWQVVAIEAESGSTTTLLIQNVKEREGQITTLNLTAGEVFRILPPVNKTGPANFANNFNEEALQRRFPYYRVQIVDSTKVQEESTE